MDQRSGNNTYGYGGNGGRGGGRGRGGEGGRGRGRGGYGGGRGRGRDGSSYQQSQSQGSGGNYQQPSGGYGGKGGGRSQFASDRRSVRPWGNQPVQSAPVQAWGNRSVQGWSPRPQGVGPMGGRGAWKGGQTKEAEAETVIVSADFMGPKLQGSINLQITSFAAAVLLGGFGTVLSILVRGFNIYKNKSPEDF